jgi:hypothetical protein
MISVYSENEWLFPDTKTNGCNKIQLETARNAFVGFQCIVDECEIGSECTALMKWEGKELVHPNIYQMVEVVVDENTDPVLMTTTNYESCKSFVTKQAPFSVYDCLKPWKLGEIKERRIAFYIEFNIPEVTPNDYNGTLSISLKSKRTNTCYTEDIVVGLHVVSAKVPKMGERKFGIMDFFCFENVAKDHNVEFYSTKYWELYRLYVRSQLGLHCTHIMLPNAEPEYDREGKLIDFNFNNVVKAAKIALEEEAPYVVGASIAHWADWTDNGYYLLWDKNTAAEGLEGFYQLKKYFCKWNTIIEQEHLTGRVYQSLADEPQTHNDMSYRAMAAVFRKCVPGVPIIEAVETFNLGGGVDIWVPKQDTYEKNMAKFEEIKANGETMWFYTCAFPAGQIMNRSMDLPLLVSRYTLWMGFYYNFSGFLHWGFNFYIGEDVFKKACCPHKGKLLPAGDAHIIYPGENDVYMSMRYVVQRAGAQECELFMKLSKEKQEEVRKLMSEVCSSFSKYEKDVTKFEAVRRKMLLLS